jgi:polyisoprenoid-binding protein YceI
MTGPIKIENNIVAVEGLFQIKDRSKKEKVTVKIDRQHNKLILTGKFKIDRTQYGIIYNSVSFFDDLKDQAIADLFEVDFYLEFERE